MSIHAYIFDFDGILAETEPLHWQALNDVLTPEKCGFSWDDYQQAYIGFDDRDAIRHAFACSHQPLSEEDLHRFMNRKAARFLEIVADSEHLAYPGAIDAVKAAAGSGPVALCTGAIPGDVEPLLARFGIRDCFQVVVTAEDVQHSKPDPESYRLTAQRLGIPPERCLAIEDTPAGLQSARGAGCRTLGVAQTHPEDALTPYADRVIPNLLEFRF